MSSVRLPKESTPQRWEDALRRSIEDGVIVRQLHPTGQWIATSRDKEGDAYQLDVIAAFAYGCSCPAAEHGDPVCKHRAAFYAKMGLLATTPEGEDPTFSPEPLMYPPLPDVVYSHFADYAAGGEGNGVDS